VLPRAYLDLVRRRVVLHFLTRLEVVLTGGRGVRLSDPLLPAEMRQRRIRQDRSARRQFLMDSHKVPLAPREQIQDLLPVRFGLLAPV
jgi:hypothetical protein